MARGAVSGPKQRERVLGWTQAFGSIGGILVTGVYYLIAANAANLPAIHGGHEPWRYTLMSGVIPAIPLDVHPSVPSRVSHLAREEGGGYA